MEIHHLKIFVSVFKNRSFTKASEELAITQPTISEHIKNLEVDLDCKLFDRLGRSIIPTMEAEAAYPRALQILADVEKLREEVAATGRELSGNLSIGASTIPGAYILPFELHAFREKNPRVSFSITIGDSGKITDMILRHELLCGLVGARMESKKLDYYPVVEDDLVLVAAPEVLTKSSIEPGELGGLPFILRESGSGTRKKMEEFMVTAGINLADLDVVATLGSSSAVKEALKAGLGVSILSNLAVKQDLQSGALRKTTIKGLDMRREFFLVQHKKRSLPAHYQAFCDYLRRRNL